MNRSPSYDGRVFTIADLEREGSARMLPMARDYLNGGSMDEQTSRDNVSSFDRYRLRPRVLIDVSSVDLTTTCLGQPVSLPFGIAPAAGHGLAHYPDAEVATARAAAGKGVAMGLSTWSNRSCEEVARAAGAGAGAGANGDGKKPVVPLAQQLSLVKDTSTNLQLIRRAESAGFSALFLTVDCVTLGKRVNEQRNDFKYPPHLKWGNLPFDPTKALTTTEDDGKAEYETKNGWEVVRWLRERTGMEVWVKGILTPEDAHLAVASGASGVIVSNHGGRQLDGVLSTIDSLPSIVDAVAHRIPVHLDGGIRRGSDIFKALALGADFVWMGRPAVWGLAYKGEDGVRLALDILEDELRIVMRLMGCRSVTEIGRRHLALLGSDGRYRAMEEEEKGTKL